MLDVKAEKEWPLQSWTTQVEVCQGNPLHLPQPLLVDFAPRDLRYLTFSTEGRVQGVALGAVHRHRRWKLGREQRSLHLPTPPALSPDTDALDGDALDELARYCRSEGFARLLIDGRWGLDLSVNTVWAPSIERTAIEFCLRLDQPLEAVLAAMERYHRKNVRRSLRQPLEVGVDSSLEACMELRELQGHSAARAAEKGSAFGVRNPGFFERTHALLYKDGPGMLLVAKHEATTVAALAALVVGNKAITVRSGSNQEGYERLAMYSLHYHLIEKLQTQGIEHLNIGGVPAEAIEESHEQHGLYLFKRGFGGMAQRRTYINLPL